MATERMELRLKLGIGAIVLLVLVVLVAFEYKTKEDAAALNRPRTKSDAIHTLAPSRSLLAATRDHGDPIPGSCGGIPARFLSLLISLPPTDDMIILASQRIGMTQRQVDRLNELAGKRRQVGGYWFHQALTVKTAFMPTICCWIRWG